MACLAGTGFVSCSRSISTLSSLRSDGLFSKVSVPVGVRMSEKEKGSSVKAMAVVKFKGTQRRENQLTEMIEKKVVEAKEVCEGDETSNGFGLF
jgi:hypothetical protein